MAITKGELHQIEVDYREKFVSASKRDIENFLTHAARSQRRTCEVSYHPLLDSFFEELMQEGLKIESRTLDKITLSWLT